MTTGLVNTHIDRSIANLDYKRSRLSLEDKARSGRPLYATNKEMCKKVRDLVYSDRRIQVEEIAQALGISHGSVSIILHDRLGCAS